jgi:hypothetical protein
MNIPGWFHIRRAGIRNDIWFLLCRQKSKRFVGRNWNRQFRKTAREIQDPLP